MTRSEAREIAVRLSFSLAQSGAAPREALDDFFEKEYYNTLGEEDELFTSYPNSRQLEYIRSSVLGVIEHRDELDGYIEKYAKGWKLHRISKISAAILRTAIFDMLYVEDVPTGAAINEAVELAKGYEEKETVAFINGILGSFARAELAESASAKAPGEAEANPDTE